jgi:small subunit ribosomal protein S7
VDLFAITHEKRISTMSRRRRAAKRETEPDPLYNSYVLTKFINKVMYSGNKSVARRIVYNAIEKFAKKAKAEDPLAAFEQALENAKPSLEVKSRRIGGATYQVPIEIAADRRTAMAMQWIIKHSREKAGRPMEEALATELFDCFTNQGSTIKKKDDTHRMAEANRAFAHYKW